MQITREPILNPRTPIDWTNYNSSITSHFTVHDACWLSSWSYLYPPVRSEKANILAVLERLEVIRAFLGGLPIIVHCLIRPEGYNRQIGGAEHSQHISGSAVDFHVTGLNCDDVRAILVPELSSLRVRMEDKPGSTWVHIDTKQSLPLYFKP